MLTLPIKRKWFDMICRGEKREVKKPPAEQTEQLSFTAKKT